MPTICIAGRHEMDPSEAIVAASGRHYASVQPFGSGWGAAGGTGGALGWSRIMLSIMWLQFSTMRFISAGSTPPIIPIMPPPRPPIMPVSGVPAGLPASWAKASDTVVLSTVLSARAARVGNLGFNISVLLLLIHFALRTKAREGARLRHSAGLGAARLPGAGDGSSGTNRHPFATS